MMERTRVKFQQQMPACVPTMNTITASRLAVNPFKYKTFYVVTGASKGLGKQTSIRLAEKFRENGISNCSALIIARNAEQLKDTREQILLCCPAMKVSISVTDLTTLKATDFEAILEDTFREQNVSATDFQQAFVVHNAASMGNITDPSVTLDDFDMIQEYFNLNITSLMVLNSVFLRVFSKENIVHKIVVNITSICALQPFKCWSLYCAAKAARDMVLRTIALEEPDIRVLNYAPGPLNTDMLVYVRANAGDPELKNMFIDMHEEKKELTPDITLDKLLRILEENKFDSGAHIDYYDD